MLCVASVDQLYVEPLLLKNLKNWDPVDPGRFHDDGFDPARAQPVSKSMKVRRKCSKGAYWLWIAIRRDRHHVHRGANVNRRCVWMDRRHLPPGGRFVCTIRDTLQCWHTRRGWAAGRCQFPNRDRHKRHHSQVRKSPWTMFFYGAYTTKKLTAAPLQRPR